MSSVARCLQLHHGLAVASAVERAALVSSSVVRAAWATRVGVTEPAVNAERVAAVPAVLTEEEPPPEFDRVVRLKPRAVRVRRDPLLCHMLVQLVVGIHHSLVNVTKRIRH